MTMWTILANIRIIMGVIADIEMVVGQIVQQQPPVPSLDQIKKVMDAVRSLLDAGIIQIKGIDDKSLSDKILQLETLLSQGAYELLKSVIRTQAAPQAAPTDHPDAAKIVEEKK